MRSVVLSILLLTSLALSANAAEPSAPLRPAFGGAGSGRAGRQVELSAQVVPLPARASPPLFVDVTGEGRCALLLIDPVEKKLLNYPARPEGYSNSPAQAIALLPQTVWAGPCDVDAHPGLELLMCTATGLVYSRQNAGLFESERHVLIQASQVFTNTDFPLLIPLSARMAGSNDTLPVISATEAVLYHRNSAYQWSAGPPLALQEQRAYWQVTRDTWDDPWTLGANPGHSLQARHVVGADREAWREPEPENAGIRKLLEEMKKSGAGAPPSLDRVDLNGNGRKDLVVWQCNGTIDWKTDLYIFLRGADLQLPERPTQVLHCHGFPIPIGSTEGWSPVHDLKGDGHRELVLLEFNTSFASSSALVKTALTHGLDWLLTVRTFHDGYFSRTPEASVPVTMVLPAEVLNGWPLFINGDFNGDGRLDLVVRRSDTQWYIYFSTDDGRWFVPEPAVSFKTPAKGYMEVKDLNGDGLADIIWHEPEAHRLSIYLSPPRPMKGRAP